MRIKATPIPIKPPRLRGLSQQLLERHYETVYDGQLQRYNRLCETIAALKHRRRQRYRERCGQQPKRTHSDLHPHAYVIDFGNTRDAYVEAFLDNLN